MNLRSVMAFVLVATMSILPAWADEPASNPVSVSKTFIVTSNAKSVSWVTCLSFANNTSRTMQAIQFQFTYKDAFDDAVGAFHADRVGEFAPGVLIEGPSGPADYLTTGNDRKAENCFSYPLVVGSVASVDVAILKVRYGDGTVWRNSASNPTTVFSGKYMSNLAAHPNKLKCGFVAEPWWWIEQQLQAGNKKVEACYNDWLSHNAPSPNPSPTP